MKISKKDRELLKIAFIFILFIICNMFIMKPINNKISQLQIEKDEIIQYKEDIEIQNSINNNSISIDNLNSYNKNGEDILLSIEREISQFLSIQTIDKTIEVNENNESEVIVTLKLNGNIQQIFQAEQGINNLGLSKNIKYIELIKNEYINPETNIPESIMDCMITFIVT